MFLILTNEEISSYSDMYIYSDTEYDTDFDTGTRDYDHFLDSNRKRHK